MEGKPNGKMTRAAINAQRHREASQICEALLICGMGVREDTPDADGDETVTEFHPLTISPEELADLAETHGLSVYGGPVGGNRVEEPAHIGHDEWLEHACRIGRGSYPNIAMMHKNLFGTKHNNGSSR